MAWIRVASGALWVLALSGVVGCPRSRDVAAVTVPPGSDGTSQDAGAGSSAPTDQRVACGDTTCDVGAGQMCCAARLPDQQARCMPASEAEACDQQKTFCDDTTDCPSGTHCCSTFDARLDTHYACEALPCQRGAEVCAEGVCAEGYVCEDDDAFPGKACRFAKVEIGCGDVKCAGTTPVCTYDASTKKGTCKARVDESMPFGHLRCDGHDDCGEGNVCVYAMGGTMCSAPEAYDTTLTNATITCQQNGDCPTQLAAGPYRCRPADDAPPTLRICLP